MSFYIVRHFQCRLCGSTRPVLYHESDLFYQDQICSGCYMKGHGTPTGKLGAGPASALAFLLAADWAERHAASSKEEAS